jgi:hypothetical protein
MSDRHAFRENMTDVAAGAIVVRTYALSAAEAGVPFMG